MARQVSSESLDKKIEKFNEKIRQKEKEISQIKLEIFALEATKKAVLFKENIDSDKVPNTNNPHVF